ncbi:MAG: EAL domain-containing response regulator [Gammaproteobacteria bacterium]|nr:EAL domain-containing response regulator [Gammaproteobacteria bacterium]
MDASLLSVMVVEDHDFQRRTVVRLLRELGVSRTLEAENGRVAMRLLADSGTSPDILLADLDMPEMDVVELLWQVAERRMAKAVAIASGLGSAMLHSVEAMARANGLQVLGIFEKPLTREKLAALIRAFRPVPGGSPRARDAAAATADEIRAGLERDEFFPVFEPKVRLRDGKLIGCETLARWRRPGQPLPLAPASFIPAMEREGLIVELTARMLERAAAQRVQWARAGLQLSVSVNISMLDLVDVGITEQFRSRVEGQGAAVRNFVLELTESAVASDLAKALHVLTRLRLKGFRLSIDDFGTGYSSLQQLSNIPFNELKIDQSFVRNCHRDSRRRSMVETSLDLARRLQLRTVAEGVETQGEWELLGRLGCDLAQGWLIGRPMTGAEFAQWAAAYAPAG